MRKGISIRKTIATAAVTLALASVTACGSSESKQEQPTSTAPAVDVALTDYMIAPHDFTAKPGGSLYTVHNDGAAPHTFSIRDDKNKTIASTKSLNPGQKEDLKVDLKAGTYVVYCEVSGHESLGMKGALVVS